ncbi:MAG TPA: helix-turn-helix transcriptional regulator [Sediminibacterium sp.]|nr:helix-turn-helix transcriptional regulator [Sediminibacterium sp.]
MSKQIKKSDIDWFIVNRVREIRLEKGLTQTDLAVHLGLSVGFIGHIESPNFIAKYNTVHLNTLARLFKCSPRDFLPEKPL